MVKRKSTDYQVSQPKAKRKSQQIHTFLNPHCLNHEKF